MAELLKGSAETAGFAPLSQAQTIAICKHLQQEIRQVEQTLSEVQRELQHTNERQASIKEKAGEKREHIHDLQLGVNDVNARLDKLDAEQGRLAEAVVALQGYDQVSREKIQGMEEFNKMADVKLGVLAQNMNLVKDQDSKLQADLGRLMDIEVRGLQKDLQSNVLRLEQFSDEQKKIIEVEKQDRETARLVRSDIENMMTEMKKSNMVINILENRLASTAKGVQENFAKFKEIDGKVIKIQECYDKTRGRAKDNEAKIKELRDIGLQTQSELEDGLKKVAHNEDRITQFMQELATECNNVEELRHQVNNLRQSHERITKSMSHITHEVRTNGTTIKAVEAGLREHSSLLLPNINLDGPEAYGGSSSFSASFGARPDSRGGSTTLPGVFDTRPEVWK
jgi:chromosome segregation ATPase